MDLNNKVVILKDAAKISFLKSCSYTLKNTKVITLSEFKNKYLFSYDKKTIKYVMDKYNVIYEVSKMYLDNLYYISDYNNDKINFLKELKNDLDSNNLLIYDSLFVNFINNSKLVLYNLDDIDDFYLNIFSKLDTFVYNSNKLVKDKQIVYEFNTKEDEVSFVCSKICELIKSNVDINKIKICNVSSDYIFTIERLFSAFNIPLSLNKKVSINGTLVVSRFKELYDSDISITLDKLKDEISNDDISIYKKLVNICNNYSFTDDYLTVKDMIYSDIENTYISNVKYKNSVCEINFNDEIITDEYVFLLGFNDTLIPSYKQDIDYLSDSIKSNINTSTSTILNKKIKSYLKNKIMSTKNLIITYKTFDNDVCYISSIYDDDFSIEKCCINYNNSNLYNKLQLVSMLDKYSKYNEISSDLLELNSHYRLNYLSFNNKYKKIDNDLIKNHIKKGLTLSYSSINEYYECGFKYYMDKFLRLNKNEDRFESYVGSLFHYVLSKSFSSDFNFDYEWKFYIENNSFDFSISNKFFLNKLKDELLFIIDTIKEQMKNTSLIDASYEKEISVKINDKLNITFKGFIDKILTKEVDGKTIVMVIDYKTGDADIALSKINYGLCMQLPIYLYLAKKEYKDVVVGGFYLQRILQGYKSSEERGKNLKLYGYTNSDVNICSIVDSSYKNSRMISSLAVKNDGDFYASSKVLSNSEMDDLTNKVEDRIYNATNKIIEGDFSINPKVLNNKNISCNYCKYKDICYMTSKDEVILGGE